MSNSFYTAEELKKLDFKKIGQNVLISKKCSIYDAHSISLGDNIRIDDFCILSGDIKIGNYVHISAYSALYGGGKIEIGSFCGVSPKTLIFSATDDFSGDFMISPIVPLELTNVKKGIVVMENYSQLGANTVIMPDVIIGEGAVTGACSLVLNNLSEWTINFGVPCKFYKNRNKNVINLSKGLLNGEGQHSLYYI